LLQKYNKKVKIFKKTTNNICLSRNCHIGLRL